MSSWLEKFQIVKNSDYKQFGNSKEKKTFISCLRRIVLLLLKHHRTSYDHTHLYAFI